MPNSREREPRISGLFIGIIIIGIIGYLIFPNLLKDIYSHLSPSSTALSLSDVNLTNMNDLNTLNNSNVLNDPNVLNPPNYSSQFFPNVDSMPENKNNALSSGFWVLYVSNGTFQQLSIGNQDYAFLHDIIQNDSKRNSAIKVFLINKGQIEQYFVSDEIYSILSNLATIYTRSLNTSTSTYSTPPTTAISETLTVNNPSTVGFTVALNPALDGLSISNFKLVSSYGNSIFLSSATTSDNGATYDISAALSAGQTYSLTATSTGYTFGTVNFNLTSASISETFTMSNPSTSGFTVALSPALNGLTVSNFKLVNSYGYPVSLSGATTLDYGATYEITATLSVGQTYTLTISCPGYTFGTPQNIEIPLYVPS